jgi:hypothetical protein
VNRVPWSYEAAGFGPYPPAAVCIDGTVRFVTGRQWWSGGRPGRAAGRLKRRKRNDALSLGKKRCAVGSQEAHEAATKGKPSDPPVVVRSAVAPGQAAQVRDVLAHGPSAHP